MVSEVGWCKKAGNKIRIWDWLTHHPKGEENVIVFDKWDMASHWHKVAVYLLAILPVVTWKLKKKKENSPNGDFHLAGEMM